MTYIFILRLSLDVLSFFKLRFYMLLILYLSKKYWWANIEPFCKMKTRCLKVISFVSIYHICDCTNVRKTIPNQEKVFPDYIFECLMSNVKNYLYEIDVNI